MNLWNYLFWSLINMSWCTAKIIMLPICPKFWMSLKTTVIKKHGFPITSTQNTSCFSTTYRKKGTVLGTCPAQCSCLSSEMLFYPLVCLSATHLSRHGLKSPSDKAFPLNAVAEPNCPVWPPSLHISNIALCFAYVNGLLEHFTELP